MDGLLSSANFPLRAVFQMLLDALRVNKSRSSDRPYVVLAFDEVHTLTKVESNRWSRFGEIRRAIRGLLKEPLFTLFLSTSGTVMSIGDVMLPFYELGFDQFAEPLDLSSQVTLGQVTSESHLTSYGRPLWHHYYESPHREDIIRFAAHKLLGGTKYVMQDLTDAEKLACLAQRVPIEFLSTLYLSQISDKEKEQVNSHMRVVLSIGGLEAMVTTSPSEPVLSEAAYYIMTTSGNLNHAQALQKILDGLLVNKGELGELIVALLFTIARDKAVGPADRTYGSPPTGQRWCSLTGLLGSLFRTPDIASENHVNVNTSGGWSFTRPCVKPLKAPLANKFKNSKVYFTHFIKVHQKAIVKVDYLVRLMARGAAILCANGQRSMDGIIPFLFDGDKICQEKIGVIE
ncbi:hypothetical protein HD554DRAFT_2078917 [Boletus coccyginus]|nr:hypothetical protein HD554DRAFT_2078917 [Boletus coccyginus]